MIAYFSSFLTSHPRQIQPRVVLEPISNDLDHLLRLRVEDLGQHAVQPMRHQRHAAQERELDEVNEAHHQEGQTPRCHHLLHRGSQIQTTPEAVSVK